MKSLKNKLFEDLKLENTEIIKVIGGIGTATSVGEDTNVSNGDGYDIAFDTYNSSGKKTGIDTNFTGPTDKDKPETCKLQNYSIQQQ